MKLARQCFISHALTDRVPARWWTESSEGSPRYFRLPRSNPGDPAIHHLQSSRAVLPERISRHLQSPTRSPLDSGLRISGTMRLECERLRQLARPSISTCRFRKPTTENPRRLLRFSPHPSLAPSPDFQRHSVHVARCRSGLSEAGGADCTTGFAGTRAHG